MAVKLRMCFKKAGGAFTMEATSCKKPHSYSVWRLSELWKATSAADSIL